METKYFIALALILVVLVAGTALLLLSRRSRDVAFFFLVAGTIYTYSLDVNFVSREWYRGTTRGFEISFLDLIAWALLPALLLRPARGQRRWYWMAGLLPMLAYAAYATLSLLFAEPKLFGLFELTKIFRGVAMLVTAALFVQSERELKVFIWAVVAAVWWEGLVALKLRYVGGVHRVYGTLPHPNSLSMFMCMCAPLLYAVAMSNWPRKLRWLALGGVALAAVAVILTISRMGVIALGVALVGVVAACFSLRLNLRNLLLSAAVILGLLAAVGYAWKTLMTRYGEASLEEEYGADSLQGRGSYLRLGVMIANENLLGVGPNNWVWWVSNEYGPRFGIPYKPYVSTSECPDLVIPPGLDGAQAPPAHNLAALTAGELGWPGLAVFALIWLRWAWMGVTFLFRRSADPASRVGTGLCFALLAVVMQSFTEWEYRQTPMMFSIHLLMGVLAGLYWQRRCARKAAAAQAAR